LYLANVTPGGEKESTFCAEADAENVIAAKITAVIVYSFDLMNAPLVVN
jgi:hypothetical protein